MLFKSVEVRCPYCGTVNMVDIEFPGYSQPRVITCDIEQGGCDKYFVVQPHVNVKVYPIWYVSKPSRTEVSL